MVFIAAQNCTNISRVEGSLQECYNDMLWTNRYQVNASLSFTI